MAAPRVAKDGAWTFDIFADLFADPAVCLISYCLPCVQYGMNAERVHGPAESCPSHGLKYCLYGCVCLCGLVGGPTRKAVRHAYKLPIQPPLGDETATGIVNPDCLTHTIPCTGCFALCQESNELRTRNVTTPLDPRPFDWAPVPPTATVAPVQAEMKKDAPPATTMTTTTA
ncbi:Protein PLANT CADMIUM RESISTANCE 6 [Chlorella vulgaris]